MRRRISNAAAVLAFSGVSLVGSRLLAAERYELLLTEASYSSPMQEQLKYSSYVGDHQNGAIYVCTGEVKLDPTTGDVANHTQSCKPIVSPSSAPGDYSFGRVSALDPTGPANAPKMSPAWGFWRIDQTTHMHGFCYRYTSRPKWSCFESALP
jgi:hypothetical protein